VCFSFVLFVAIPIVSVEMEASSSQIKMTKTRFEPMQIGEIT
jgi:hypothetical protein